MAENNQLNWNSFSALQKEDYLKSHKPDCSFLVGSDAGVAKTFECHKFVLSSVSEVFERMFNGDFKEATSCHDIPLTDVERPQDFKEFLNYLYYKDIYAFHYYTFETLITLHKLGNKYLIDSLEKLCAENIEEGKCLYEKLPITDLLSLFSYDHSKGVKFGNVITTPKYLMELLKLKAKLNDINKIYCFEPPVFSAFLEFLDLHGACTGIFAFNMIERYALQNNLDMYSSSYILKPWFKYVSFYDMSLAEFINGPMCSKVLNWNAEEKLSMLVALCKEHEYFV